MGMSDTIVALATPPGNGALGIIRISGSAAHEIFKKRISRHDRFEQCPSKEINLYRFIDIDSHEILDEITALKYTAPQSYTGEHMVEIICHGGTITVERILESLINTGARYAEKGEFTRRAFINGKTSLMKAESINQMIHSTSIPLQKNAIQHYCGGYVTLVQKWEEYIKEILVDIETEIEFGEEEVSTQQAHGKIVKKIIALKNTLLEELNKRERIKEIEQGISIAIIGPTNAGKSSLFNVLLGFERALVDYRAGTTRDFISENRMIGSIPTRLIDTAGLTSNAVGIEKQGVDKSRELIQHCNILLWVTPANENISQEEAITCNNSQTLLGVINKIDLSDGENKRTLFKKKGISYIAISAHNHDDKNTIETFLINEIQKKYEMRSYDCIIANKRQEEIIRFIYNELHDAEKRVVGEEEIMAFHCWNILEKLEEFVGKKAPDDILNKVFSEFCVGK